MPLGDPSCPVLDVHPWFWDAVRIGSLIQSGSLSPSEVAGRTWEAGEVAWAELEAAREMRRAMDAKRREWIEKHTKAPDGRRKD